MGKRIKVENFIVCDDIRREDNGKLILIGVYAGNMIVSELPMLLPKLSFYFLVSGALPGGQGTLCVYSPHKKTDREFPVEISSTMETGIGSLALGLSPFIITEDGRYTVLLKFASGQMIRRGFHVIVGKEEQRSE